MSRGGRLAAWQRCESCRKVLAADQYDGAATICIACTSGAASDGPVRKPRAVTSPVTRIRPSERPVAPTASAPRLGVAGSGDLEVRERRARRVAHQALADQYPEEFAQLLSAARAGEGLRA